MIRAHCSSIKGDCCWLRLVRLPCRFVLFLRAVLFRRESFRRESFRRGEGFCGGVVFFGGATSLRPSAGLDQLVESVEGVLFFFPEPILMLRSRRAPVITNHLKGGEFHSKPMCWRTMSRTVEISSSLIVFLSEASTALTSLEYNGINSANFAAK